MNSKLDVRKMIDAVAHPRVSLRPSRFINPAREWFVGLALMIVMMVIGLAYAGNLFVTQLGIDNFAVAGEGLTAEVYKHNVIEDVLKNYTTKQSRFDQLYEAAKNSAPAIAPAIVEEVAEGMPSQVE